jgi:quercetin dioxygenase-like cupin family protein
VAQAGEHLRNTVTGEELVFRRTGAETEGELLEFDWRFPAGGSVGLHVHGRQEERFEVLSGSARFRVGRRRLTAGAGEELAVPPGAVHGWGNAGEDELWARVQFRPALRTEHLFRALFALEREGGVDRKGRPRLLPLATLLHEFRDEIQVPWVPASVQGRLLALLAALCRRRG